MNTWLDIVTAELVALGFLALLLVSAGGAYLILRALNPLRDDQPLLGAVALVAGPLSLSFIASLALKYAPGLPSQVYIFAPLGLIVVSGLTLRLMTGAPARNGVPEAEGKDPLALVFVSRTAAIAAAATIIAYFVFTLFTPLYGNDTLEYSRAAQLISETRSLANYPFLDRAITGGLVTPWTHPPGHITLVGLAAMFQGDAVNATALKVLTPYFAAAQAAILICFAGHGGRRYVAAGYVAALLTISAPVYFASTLQNHIDTMRLAAFTAAIAATWLAIRHETFGSAVVAGVACAAAGFSHSIGMLTLGLTIPAYFILSQAKLPTRFRNAALIGAIGIVSIAPTLLANLQAFGSPLQDLVPAWTLPNVQFNEFVALDRGLETPFRQLVFGVLRAFSEPELFGWTYWIFALAVLLFSLQFLLREARIPNWRDFVAASQNQATLCVAIVAGFFALLLISLATDSIAAIKNARYSMTMLPLAAVAAARLLVDQITGPER